MQEECPIKFSLYVCKEDVIKDLHIHLPPYLIGVFSLIDPHATEAYLVGGAVRDLILGNTPKDFDIVTDASYEVLEKVFKKDGWSVQEAGTDFKVLHVARDGMEIEIARFRKDIHPEPNVTQVVLGDIVDDALRRDLTINALYLDPWSGDIHDPTGTGLDALVDGKLIEFMGCANTRIEEDYTRILRFYRFVSKLREHKFDVCDELSLIHI